MRQDLKIEIINPDVVILTDPNRIKQMPQLLEIAGRTCYKSEAKITEDSAEKFVRKLIKLGHESVLEHESISVRFIGSRSFSHQLVRHRIGAYSQESQRYCNYGKSEALQVILPTFITPHRVTKPIGFNECDVLHTAGAYWAKSCLHSYEAYLNLLDKGIRPEDAREVLPNAVKTEVVTTYNLRQWRHFFKVRCSSHAQVQIRHLALLLLHEFTKLVPSVFDDLKFL